MKPVARTFTLKSTPVTINDKRVTIIYPEGDATYHGTMRSFGDNQFALDKAEFKPGDVMLDIGCNCGVLSIFVATLFPFVHVISFDASEAACLCLKLSAAANGLVNIDVYRLAVGDANRKGVRFYSDGIHTSNLISEFLRTPELITFEEEADMIAIDEVFDSRLLNIDRVKYMKMDIEGGEYDIFDRLFRYRPDILDRIECLNLERHNIEWRDPVALGKLIHDRFGPKAFLNYNAGDQWDNPLHQA